jgi:hypothetical protein
MRLILPISNYYNTVCNSEREGENDFRSYSLSKGNSLSIRVVFINIDVCHRTYIIVRFHSSDSYVYSLFHSQNTYNSEDYS